MIALLMSDLRLATRAGGGFGLGLAFFLIVCTLVPFGVGPQGDTLARIAPGILWVGALLACLLSLDRIFALDWEDGSLDLLATDMRSALLGVPDSAEVVSSSWASGLSSKAITADIIAAGTAGGLSVRDAEAVSTALCQLVIGLTIEEQTRAQMERLGVTGPSGRDFAGEFRDGLAIILDGARTRRSR